MARIRGVKPEFFTDPDIGELSLAARLLFIGLWTQADRDGRLIDDIRQLKIRLFPFDDDINLNRLDKLLAELQAKKMIHRYAGTRSDPAGKNQEQTGVSTDPTRCQTGVSTGLAPTIHDADCIWITHFTRHQRPHHTENASLISAWTPETLERDGVKPERDGVKTVLERFQTAGSLIIDHGSRTSTAAAEIGLGQLSQPNGQSLLLPSVAAGVSDETRAAAAEVTEILTTTIPKATNDGRLSLQRVTDVEAPRKQKPVFMGTRFSVFDWQLRELEAMVGTDAFDVLEFLFGLDSRHTQSGQVIPRDSTWAWLQAQVLGEARRRGMPVVVTGKDLSPMTTRMMDAVARFVAEDES
jgi:hypothetical protein